jgi:hypothetical protein
MPVAVSIGCTPASGARGGSTEDRGNDSEVLVLRHQLVILKRPWLGRRDPRAGSLVRMAFEAHPVTKERWPDLVELSIGPSFEPASACST